MQKKIDIACINKPGIIFYKDSILLCKSPENSDSLKDYKKL